MNPLTQIRNTQKASKFEVAQGLSEKASWHARYAHSAYIFAGGLPFDLSEGDILAIFAQYGELTDVNVVKDRDTGKSRGFAFVAYEDQRSTTLAVDNLSGTRVTGRIIRVEHVDNYKRKKAEVEGREASPDTDRESPRTAAPPTQFNDASNPDAASGRRDAPDDPISSSNAPWMNSNSIVSMLAESAATEQRASVVEKHSSSPKRAKHKKLHKKDTKMRSEDKSTRKRRKQGR